MFVCVARRKRRRIFIRRRLVRLRWLNWSGCQWQPEGKIRNQANPKRLGCGVQIAVVFRFVEIKYRHEQEADANKLMYQIERSDKTGKRHLTARNQIEWIKPDRFATDYPINQNELAMLKQPRNKRPDENGHS
jgi:hypothetical protein